MTSHFRIRPSLFTLFSCLVFWCCFATPQQVVIVSYAESDTNGFLTTTGSCSGIARANYFPGYLTNTSPLNLYGPPAALYGARQTADNPGPNVIQSLIPSSRTFRVPLHLGYDSGSPADLVDEVLSNELYSGKTVFIVWDFYEIPSLINAFGYSSPAAPNPIAYNRTYILQFPINSPFPLTLCQSLNTCDTGCVAPPPPPPPPPPAPPSPPAPPAPPTPPSPTTDFLPITFVDPNVALFDTWVVITGKVPIGEGITPTQSCFIQVDPLTGKGVRINTTADKSSLDYAFKLSSLPKLNGNPYLYVPYLESARISFSIGALGGTANQWALDFYTKPNSQGGYDIAENDPLVNTDPNYYLLFDKAEMSFLPTGRLSVVNVTAVDFFGLPIYTQLLLTKPTSSNPTQSCGFWQGRSSCFTAFERILNSSDDQTVSKLWNNLFINYELPGSSLVNLRLASTQKAIKFTSTNPSTPIFPPDYLSNASYFVEPFNWVNSVWKTFYGSSGPNRLFIDCTEVPPPYNIIMTGTTDTSSPYKFNFTNSSGVTTLSSSLNLPADSYGFFSADFAEFGATTDVQKVLVKNLTSGFSSGIFPVTGSSQTLNMSFFAANKTDYYTNTFLQVAYPSQSGPFYDLYAKAIHQSFPDNPPQIYAFAYDDQLGIDGQLKFDVSEEPYLTFTFGSLAGQTLVNPYSSTQTYNTQIAGIGNDTKVKIGVNEYTSSQIFPISLGSITNLENVIISKISNPSVTYTTNIYFTPPKGIQRPTFNGITGTVITSSVSGGVGNASITFGSVS